MIHFPNCRVVITRPMVIDDMGSTAVTWVNAETIPVPGECHIQHGPTRDDFERADSTETDFTLWAPLDVQIKTRDRVSATITIGPTAGQTIGPMTVIGEPTVMIDPIDPDETFQRLRLKRYGA